MNRRFLGAVLIALGAQCILFFGHWSAGVDVATSEVALPLVWAAVLGMVAVGVEPRLWPAAVAQAAAFLAAATWPSLRFWLMGAAMAATTINFVIIWSRQPPAVVDRR